MKELMVSPYFGVALSIVAFWIGVKLNHKLKTPVCNPLIVAIVLIVGVLLVFDIPYDTYNVGGELINMFLAPATACLAVAIYTKLDILKQYWPRSRWDVRRDRRHPWEVYTGCADCSDWMRA